MPCDGDQTEICGGGNRILIYQDAAWVLLTDAEFVAQLQALEQLLQQYQVLIQQWNQDLQTYSSALNDATENQDTPQPVSLEQVSQDVNADQQAIINLSNSQDISKYPERTARITLIIHYSR
jgi:hypothetical protein